MSSTIEQSNGFLPLAVLQHADPTAVGVWDLDGKPGIRWPPEQPLQAARDQLVLARLHQQPVALLHLHGPPERETRERLIAAVWEHARVPIVEHIQACRCLSLPADARELGSVLAEDPGICAGLAPVRPAGRAAVIVCTVGRGAELTRALRSLTQMDCQDFEVIVVDNRPSQPETRSTVEAFASPVPVRYVAEPRPGLAIARNAGVGAASDADFVAFTDDDVVVDGRWLSWLLAPFARGDTTAATGLVMPLSLGSPVEKRFEHYAGFGKGLDYAVYDLDQHRAGDRFLYPYWGGMFGSGNSMAFRRRALVDVGGFDPALGAGTPTAGGEDLAAFSDIILAGGRLVYEPRSLCWHAHRADELELRTQVRNYGIGLTAVLWRYFTSDRRFTTTLLRSLPGIVQLARRRNDDRQVERLPSDLARLELQGRLLGPWRYLVSGRLSTGGKPPGAARRYPGGRRAESDQPAAQTRT